MKQKVGLFIITTFFTSFLLFEGRLPAQVLKYEAPAIQRPAPEGERDWMVFRLDEPLRAVVLADLEGDGKPELVGMAEREVIAYRLNGTRLLPFTRWEEGEPFVRYLWIEAADLNRNGRDEIFVTALFSVPRGLRFQNSLHSFALELHLRDFLPLAVDLPYFLRILKRPGREPALLAQRIGEFTPFKGPILRMVWNGRGYVEEVPLSIPAPALNLYTFLPVEGFEVAVLEKDRLKVYRGQVTWEGGPMGEVDHLAFLQTPKHLQFPTGLRSGPPRPEEIAEKYFLPRRLLLIEPLFGDGDLELVTVANSTRYGFRLPFIGEKVSGGRVIAYIRRGETYSKSWETRPVEGKALDFAIGDLTGDGRREIVLLIEGKKGRSTVYLFFPRSPSD